MSSYVDSAREVLAGLAPEIPGDDVTEDADFIDDLRLDPLTRYALAFNLERILKVQIPDSRVESARTLAELVADTQAS
ncbi:acyl carrier protein [Flaviflexus equikiangi]|uniref:Carrier domain-containing protein n=1 Tax=Flaviflexus equikiangi TaxID=2758573 RepID=A0ABS2TGF2_9ACTO|nr:phosphopantetheine-binding protein [Flaviflexus equikiangi]MBM9433198.1 hypothetical protein [Flaviflexus equikiangi]